MCVANNFFPVLSRYLDGGHGTAMPLRLHFRWDRIYTCPFPGRGVHAPPADIEP